jgi:hypothetical protein
VQVEINRDDHIARLVSPRKKQLPLLLPQDAEPSDSRLVCHSRLVIQ